MDDRLVGEAAEIAKQKIVVLRSVEAASEAAERRQARGDRAR